MKIRILATMALVAAISGCATPLHTGQKQELRNYEQKGIAIEEKNASAAIALGFLPGMGSFYTGHPVPGVVNFLFWPLSILWDPVSGYNGAQVRNYYATKHVVDKNRKKELAALEDEFLADRITKEGFYLKKREIENKYAYD